jgi:hypothetical protein
MGIGSGWKLSQKTGFAPYRRLRFLAIPEANAKATARVLPDDRNPGLRTDDSAGAALQATGIVKTDLAVFEGIKACRAGIGARLGLAGCAHGLVQNDMSLIVVNGKFIEPQQLFDAQTLQRFFAPFQPSMASCNKLMRLSLIWPKTLVRR